MPNDNVLTEPRDAIARSKRILALVDEYHENPTRDTRTTLRAALMDEFQPEPRAEVTGWQPIETAPKETELLGWRKDCGVLLIMYTSFDRWASEAECEEIDEETLFQKDWFGTALPGIMDRLEGEQVPTHWMPLPAEPGDAARAGGQHADQA